MKLKKDKGLYYNPSFLSLEDRSKIITWIKTLHPIWEHRYSEHHPPPPGEPQRQLLRPVYWLGNWQFACLGYYHPPHGIHHRCIQAEPFPPVLAKIVNRIHEIIAGKFSDEDLPEDYHLNTCLINFYGTHFTEDQKEADTARVGEHKDFEPGPVASLSLGNRALFQFVESSKKGSRDKIVAEQWLDDRSLQIFGGNFWKNKVFHRVQRVDRKEDMNLDFDIKNFKTRRLNFTFRYVPEKHIIAFNKLCQEDQSDLKTYLEELAKFSPFYENVLKSI